MLHRVPPEPVGVDGVGGHLPVGAVGDDGRLVRKPSESLVGFEHCHRPGLVEGQRSTVAHDGAAGEYGHAHGVGHRFLAEDATYGPVPFIDRRVEPVGL